MPLNPVQSRQYYRLDVGSLNGQFWQSRVDHAKSFDQSVYEPDALHLLGLGH